MTSIAAFGSGITRRSLVARCGEWGHSFAQSAEPEASRDPSALGPRAQREIRTSFQLDGP